MKLLDKMPEKQDDQRENKKIIGQNAEVRVQKAKKISTVVDRKQKLRQNIVQKAKKISTVVDNMV